MTKEKAPSASSVPEHEPRHAPATYALLAEAIEHQKAVRFTYSDNVRYGCPHALGTTKGRARCLFYQYDGHSSQPLEPVGSARNWRCLPVDALYDLACTDDPWHTADTHSSPQTCIVEVDVQTYTPDSDPDAT